MEFTGEESARVLAVVRVQRGRPMIRASNFRRRPVVKWLREVGCPWYPCVILYAVNNNNIEQILWLRSQGCPWNESSLFWAAQRGFLTLVQWLREQGCPWSGMAVQIAMDAGYYIIADWLIRNGCPYHINLLRRIMLIFDLELLKIIIELNPHFLDEALRIAEKHCRTHMITYLKSLE